MARNTILAALLLFVVCGVANAAEPKARGAYIGGSIGASVFDDDGLTGGFFDDEDSSVLVYGGYKFFKYFAVEGRYAELGSFSSAIGSLDITAISAHAVGIIPFGTSGWELFGQLGVAQVKLEVPGLSDGEETAGAAGIGVRWHINQSFTVGAHIDAYAWQDDDFGSVYDISVATNQLTFQINF